MENARPTPRRHVGLWILVLGGAVVAFIASQKNDTPAHAPTAAPTPAPTVTHTEIIHTITTQVVHAASPVSGTDIVLILAACLLATVALFAIGTARR